MIVCLRVDERLIHGQVAMTWTKELKLNGLVVASDEAASNGIQKMTLKMAVPEGIKCIIKSVEDVTTILDDPRSESMRLMVLVPMVKDAVTLCKRYKNIEMVNIGNAGKENLIKRSYADSRRTGSTERTDRALSGHIFPGNTGDGKENGICNIKGMLIKIG